MQSLDYYLTFAYVPTPKTIFEGIQKLPPAMMLICEDGQTRIEKYWDLDNTSEEPTDQGECAERLYELLADSVRMRLISDVPLGAFLSGGIDSSIIVGLMAEHSSVPVKTFSIGFDEEKFSELEYARMIAQRFSTDHHEYIVTSNVKELIPKLIWHYSEPVGDSSAIPTYYVSKMTRQSVTVALSGDGGDELFAGYGKYPIIQRICSAKRLDGIIRMFATKLFLNKDFGRMPVTNIVPRIQRSLKYRFSLPTDRDFMWISPFDRIFKNHLYTAEINHSVKKEQARAYYNSKIAESPNEDVLSQILFRDLTSYLPDDLLIKVDITSMANSLEVRSPFLDHRFVEFAARIPNSLKLRNGKTKYILQKTFAHLLPQKILQREKMGFSIPIDKWIKEDLLSFSYDILLDNHSPIAAYFNQRFLKYMLQSHQSGTVAYGMQLWMLINFALWYDMFIHDF
jgi:asparagine synthase (glutamine-hydrolysing)